MSKELTVEEQLKAVQEQEKRRIEFQAHVDDMLDRAANQITLSIGGTEFVTSRNTLLSHKGSVFDSLLSGDWKPDASGRYFVDRHPDLFNVVLRYLRTGKLITRGVDLNDLKAELEYYRIEIPEPKYPHPPEFLQYMRNLFVNPSPFIEAAVQEALKYNYTGFNVDFEPTTAGTIENSIREWLGTSSTFTKIYTGSIDGFGGAVFHKKCDNKGPTLVLMQSSGGYLFGGYAPVSWESPNSARRQSVLGAFVFTITNPHQIPPSQFLLPQVDALCFNSSYGPIFGHDTIVISNDPSGCYFASASGLPKGELTFTGASKFVLTEIEVYTVVKN